MDAGGDALDPDGPPPLDALSTLGLLPTETNYRYYNHMVVLCQDPI